MKKVLKYLYRFFSRVDISPIDRGGIIKGIIFVIWGLNAYIFIGIDCLCEEALAYSHAQCLIYNITETLSSVEINIDNEIIFDSSPVGTIASYNVTPLPFEPVKIVRDRSPPIISINHIFK